MAYALYDIDGDGIKEAFVRDKNDDYGCLTCGGGQVKLVISSTTSTALYFCKGKPYVIHQGGCGTGCSQNDICRIENSKPGLHLQHIGLYGPEGQEEHECSSYQNGDGKQISYTLYKQLAPKFGELTEIKTLKWISVSAGQNNSEASAATSLHTISGDTIIVKDAKGYFYQITSDETAGVAPGGAYSGDIVIPSYITYDGSTYKVSTVRRGAMWKKAGVSNIGSITSIILPETVTLVGTDAFRGNTNLTSVKYGSKTRIEVRSFWGCPKLKVDKKEPVYAYTEPVFWDEEMGPYDKQKMYPYFTRMYYPVDQQDIDVMNNTWAFFKSNHVGIAFDSWKNLDNEKAMACYCTRIKNVKAGLFLMQNPDNVESMFRGYLKNDNTVVLTDNNYVATHEFPAFSRWVWGEDQKSMPQDFISSMEKKYGRKVNYSYECGKLIRSGNEQVAITEFKITNHEAMFVLSWLKDGKEVCNYEQKQKLEVGQDEDMSVWNADDDGTYGIPAILTIARDERGNIELFLNHNAPESISFFHLVQQGNKFVETGSDSWYSWIDSPE